MARIWRKAQFLHTFAPQHPVPMKTLLYSFCTLILMVCQPMKETMDKPPKDGLPAPTGDLPAIQIGTNAKASLKINEQTRMAQEFLDQIPAGAMKNLHVRIPGGTRSQREKGSDWSDPDMKKWIDLQKKYGFGFIWVVNGNDTPENQKAFIQRWQNMGAKFTFLEMMNEYYLPKFAQGKTEKPEVTRRVTAEDYAGEILDAWLPVMATLNLPIFVHVAPKRTGKQGEQYAHFNKVVTKAVREKFKGYNLGIAVHLYERADPFDYGQIAELRKQLPPGTPIAITETGNLNESVRTSEAVAPLIYNHYRRLAAELKPGDYLIDHCLYNDYKNETEANLHPKYKGMTPKGEAVLRFFRDIYP